MKFELRSVRIKNIGPIDDIKIDFFDANGKTLPVCVIGGANGSGKTTVLEVIASLAEILSTGKAGAFLRSKRNGYAQADLLVDKYDFSIFFGTSPGDAKLKKEHCGEQTEGITFVSTPLYADLHQRIRSQQGNPSSGTYNSYAWNAAGWNAGNPSPQQLSDIYWAANELVPSLIYFPHSRSLEPVSGQQIQKEEANYRFIHRFQTVRQFPGSLTSYLIYLDYADPDQFSDVRQFLNDLDFDGKAFHIDRKKLDVIVKTANGHEHSMHELSSGEQNLLIIFTELRRKLLPGSIVMIDEIENSLHPAYQHRLAQGLLTLQRKVPYQLIVTTHAHAFVEIFGEENTRILTPF
jgi:predicted ATPase